MQFFSKNLSVIKTVCFADYHFKKGKGRRGAIVGGVVAVVQMVVSDLLVLLS